MTEIKQNKKIIPKSPVKDFSFNEALNRLQQLVEEMDNPDLDLKDAINKFKEATELAKSCKNQLKDAEITIKELMTTMEELESDQQEEI